MRSALLNLSLEEARARSLEDAPALNPVIPGDHPDPSIVRVGQHYWACSTSGEWSPQFPLFHSADLKHWEPAGHVFTEQPRWAEGAFWAPELVYDRGRFVVYYVGRARGGPLSIAVATANAPRGPWTDHGPILAEPLGSIDPTFTRDEHGMPYLVWKTDGNSEHQPTPIWAQPLSSDLLRLTGRPTQLITNDQPWEGGVVEGAYIMRRAHRFYMFYAGNDCCGRFCKYAEGVARADHLLGPWVKSPDNPIVQGNDTWRCPGHGTAVRGFANHGQPGQDYLLYHAYPSAGTVFVGREAVLDRIEWNAEGWPHINAGHGPHTSAARPAIDFIDEFVSPVLGSSWQWPVNTSPTVKTGLVGIGEGEGGLLLRVPGGRQSAMLAVPIPGVPQHTATVRLNLVPRHELASVPDPEQPATPTLSPPVESLWAGLSVVGDPFNTIGIGLREGVLQRWVRRGSHEQISWWQRLPQGVGQVWLRLQYLDGAQLQFGFSVDGEEWTPAGDLADGSPLPAWDRGLRIGLMLEGPSRSSALFQHFSLCAHKGQSALSRS